MPTIRDIPSREKPCFNTAIIYKSKKWRFNDDAHLSKASPWYAGCTQSFLSSHFVFGLEHGLTSLSLEMTYIKARLLRICGLNSRLVSSPLVICSPPASLGVIRLLSLYSTPDATVLCDAYWAMSWNSHLFFFFSFSFFFLNFQLSPSLVLSNS